jgi:hypothetical protein
VWQCREREFGGENRREIEFVKVELNCSDTVNFCSEGVDISQHEK